MKKEPKSENHKKVISKKTRKDFEVKIDDKSEKEIIIENLYKEQLNINTQ
jgi:hypothetical protein